TSLVADLETPVSAMLKLAAGKPNSFLFESVEGGERIGRYSIIGLKPDLIWRCFRDRAEINRNARQEASSFDAVPGGALQSLRALIAECRVEPHSGLPPMAAGLFGYLGYATPTRIRWAFPTACCCGRASSASSTRCRAASAS